MPGEQQPITTSPEQLTLDVPAEFLGRVVMLPTLATVQEELRAQIMSGMRRIENEAAQGTLFAA